MRKLFILALFLACASVANAQLGLETVFLTIEGKKLEGTLACPSIAEKVPLVIIISGSGPTDRDGNNPMMKNNSLKMLSEALLKHNIASLRYDKRGVGVSQPIVDSEKNLRFEHYVSDVKEWVKRYESDSRFSSIVICGHSEGALVGLLAAQTAQVDKYISIAGASMSAADIIRSQLAAQPAVLSMSEPILSQLEKGEEYPDAPPMLNALFRASVQPYLISWFKYNPAQELAKLKMPILIVQGTTDLQVKVEDVDKLLAANLNCQKLIVDGMNHVLKEAPLEIKDNMATYSQPNLTLHPELIGGIVHFIIQ